MASLWEADSIQISPLADAQYPQFGTSSWQYIFPHSSISADGDVHIDMAVDASGTGSTGNNTGESPIIAEVINAVASQLTHLQALSGHQALTRGIFRFYTEHASERHLELHPITELFTNNGASFVLDTSYRANVVSVSDGTTHADSTLIGVFDGSQTVTAQVMANNSDVIFTYPSPSVNYVQYDGVALSGLLSDSVSLFFWFRPSLVPSATVRCRLLTNTAAASAATGLSSNLAMTVNALTRTDMAGVSNQIASLTANQSSTFARPIELITLGIIGVSPAQLTISPVSDFVSSGPVAGPFSPHAQTYTLTNSGGATLNWAATNTANWVSLLSTSGVLAPGASTPVSVTINGNANALPAGNYSDTIAFTNITSGGGNITRAVMLTVNSTQAQLSASPATAFASSGPPGGPFTPPAQTYALNNSGGAALDWTASNGANWLTLSPTSGTLAPGSSTNVTVTLNQNANSLALGNYSDTVGFTNINNGAGNSTRAVTLTVNNFGFFDDFYTFASGNLVGQSNWTQLTNISTLPLQVSGGQVTIPGGQTANNQDAYKNFAETNATVFYGLTFTVNSPVTNASPSYFAALFTSNDGVGFANFRLTAKAGDANRTNFVLGLRVTGQTSDPYTFGSTLLSTGAQYRVIVQAPAGGASMSVFVNPSSPDLASQSAYANNPIGGGTPPTSVGSLVISQFGSSTLPSDGVSIGKAVVADNFATVYNDLLDVLTPFQAWQIYYFGSTNNPAAAANADPDGDGQNNSTEFLAGTDPTNSASSFRITAIGKEANDIRVTWLTGVGKTSALQESDGGVGGGLSGSFTDLFVVSNTTGGTTNYLDPGAITNASARYYRVRLVP